MDGSGNPVLEFMRTYGRLRIAGLSHEDLIDFAPVLGAEESILIAFIRMKRAQIEAQVQLEQAEQKLARTERRIRKAGREMAWLREEVAVLDSAANRDALTGLYNRRGFEKAFSLAHERLASQENPDGLGVTLIAFDLNGMKQVNDGFGHAAGDEFIKGFASAIAGQAREGDVAVRFGGDEFYLMLVDVDEATGDRRARDIVSAINGEQGVTGHVVAWEDLDLPLSTSFGTSHHVPQNGEKAGAVLAPMIGRADEALYGDKERRAPERMQRKAVIAALAEGKLSLT
jgi:diguanylate cyclase (GGDEF)-like protein